MSKQSSHRTRKGRTVSDEPVRNVGRFVKSYLGSETGRRLLSSRHPKMALAFQAAIGEQA